MYRLLSILLPILVITSCSQYPNRDFIRFSENGNSYVLEATDGKYVFQYYSHEILEVHFIPDGEQLVEESHAVVMELPESEFASVSETEDYITIDSDGIDVSIQKEPFRIAFNQNGRPLLKERAGYSRDSLETIEFGITKDEALYGAGSRALGMDRRGHRLPLYNRAHYGYETYSEQMNFSIPIVLSSNRYLLHFDNAPIGFLDLDSKGKNTIRYETISGRKTYQLVVGDDWLDIMDNYTQLTGRQPMIPRWALGNFSSRFGYHSQEEVMQTISRFKEDEIPVDAVILDLYWFGKDVKGTLGDFEFYADSFPDPDRMIRELREMDVETILITEPFVLKTSKRWDEAIEKGILAVDSTGEAGTFEFYFGEGGIIDVYSEEGYSWFSDINRGLLDMGVTGIWGDLGEPEAHPSYLIHETGTANELHNVYGHDWARLVYSTFRDFDPDKRPFILMRAGYSGSQRYGLIPWSGDVNRTWGGLNRQAEIAMQMGMQGIAYMHSDLGGFGGDYKDGELYTRWLQYGVFQPVYRPHAQDVVPSEPVFWDDTTKALTKAAIELRYRLLPYNYSLSWENNQTGAPLMRPLFFEEPDNDMLYDYDASYLWGASFLVAPILEPGVKRKELYLPDSSDWFDFYSGQRYEGGQTVEVDVADSHIPVFVRSGALIPMAKALQTTKEYDGNTLELHYFYDEEAGTSAYSLYNDDGLTFEAYERGAYERILFEMEPGAEELILTMEAQTGDAFKSRTKKVELVIHNLKAAEVHIRLGDESLTAYPDEDKRVIRIPVEWNSADPATISIRF
ncbi:MAG: TIM-barrel domain-containing protein [Bacteroidota bacterium]